VPETVSEYFLKVSGASVKDPRVSKLVSLAADKFLADTINLASQNARLRRQNVKIPNDRKREEKRKQEITETFEIEDLYGAFAEQHVHAVLKRKRKGGE
jgi:transcription initiation factor TFIID subunit 10